MIIVKTFMRAYADELVGMAYCGILAREADPAGLAAYSKTLKRSTDLAGLLKELSYSDEHWEKSLSARAPQLVQALYMGLLGRKPEAEELDSYAKKLAETHDLMEILPEIAQKEKDSKVEEKRSDEGLVYGDIVRALYLGILERPADEDGLESYLGALLGGIPLTDIIREMIESDEFQSHQQPSLVNSIVLPDLTKLYPEKYVRKDADSLIFKVSSDDDFRLMKSLIVKNRYYDSLGVWAPEIDLDKHVTAAIVRGLGARDCIEMGCFTGPVLSLLEEQGIDVCGVEISHLAFLLAHANVHEKIRFGDLLDLDFDRTYDLFLGMNILEHLNPLDMDLYIARIAKLINLNGFAYINSPMFGIDDVFGTVFEAFLPEWHLAGEDVFWSQMHCDAKGWPMHGQLVWASPKWWESAFLKHGLVRDRDIERAIHALLEPFFEKIATARRSFFVLKHSDFNPDIESIRRNLSLAISPVVADIG